MRLFSLRYFYFVLYDITILLPKPENTLSARRPQNFIKPIPLSMDSDRKPARIVLSQPEWTFSDNALEQYLLLMTG
jgi:hypothetical protein